MKNLQKEPISLQGINETFTFPEFVLHVLIIIGISVVSLHLGTT